MHPVFCLPFRDVCRRVDELLMLGELIHFLHLEPLLSLASQLVHTRVHECHRQSHRDVGKTQQMGQTLDNAVEDAFGGKQEFGIKTSARLVILSDALEIEQKARAKHAPRPTQHVQVDVQLETFAETRGGHVVDRVCPHVYACQPRAH